MFNTTYFMCIIVASDTPSPTLMNTILHVLLLLATVKFVDIFLHLIILFYTGQYLSILKTMYACRLRTRILLENKETKYASYLSILIVITLLLLFLSSGMYIKRFVILFTHRRSDNTPYT